MVLNDYPLTATVEFVGYAGRAIAYDDTDALIPYVLQSTLLLIAPILFAASLYMTLSRIIRSVHGESYSLIPPPWLTRIFVFGDMSSFFIQSRGAGIRVQTGRGNSNISPTGAKIIVSGLVLQIAILAIYMATTMLFHSTFGPVAASNAVQIPWRQSMYMLYATSVLIMARNVYRIVEYAIGSDGYLLNHEWPVFFFDTGLMVLTMVIFYLRCPSTTRRLSDKLDKYSLVSGKT